MTRSRAILSAPRIHLLVRLEDLRAAGFGVVLGVVGDFEFFGGAVTEDAVVFGDVIDSDRPPSETRITPG